MLIKKGLCFPIFLIVSVLVDFVEQKAVPVRDFGLPSDKFSLLNYTFSLCLTRAYELLIAYFTRLLILIRSDLFTVYPLNSPHSTRSLFPIFTDFISYFTK